MSAGKVRGVNKDQNRMEVVGTCRLESLLSLECLKQICSGREGVRRETLQVCSSCGSGWGGKERTHLFARQVLPA